MTLMNLSILSQLHVRYPEAYKDSPPLYLSILSQLLFFGSLPCLGNLYFFFQFFPSCCQYTITFRFTATIPPFNSFPVAVEA
ncbi:MAG: hypothetical protein N3E41_08620 [Thermofilaceae archaeon]|nr:hypothetical protein [Thermofilaceae archaeon]